MRKIKFRARDKIDKKIYKVIGIDWYDKTCKVQSDDYEFRELNDSIFNDLIFIQFTGLLDKNGKEIYEGDFYKRILDKENRFKKSYEWADYWLVEWLDEHACFTATYIGENTDKGMIKITPKRNRYSLLNYLEIDEIIGNIFENPELIEGATK